MPDPWRYRARMTASGDPGPENGPSGWKQEAGRLAAMVAGLNAVVWERDPDTLEVRWVNERIAELLGHPVASWYAEPDLWRRVLHPDDRDEAIAAVRRAVAERRDFALGYRVIAADGRLLWLHHLGHVAFDAAGRPEALHGVLVDVTAERRREQAVRVSAAVGTLLSGPEPLPERLQQVVELLVGDVCDEAAVWLRDDDGRYSAVAAAPAALADQVLALDPLVAPPELHEAYERGEPFVLPRVTERMLRDSTDDEEHYAAAAAAVAPAALLVVPFRGADGPVLGTLAMDLLQSGRRHDAEDVALAADLARWLAVTVSAERADERQRQLLELSVALSAAGSVAEAAAQLAHGLRAVLRAELVTVCTVGEDGLLHPVHTLGYAADLSARFSGMRLSSPYPLTVAARTRRPQWLPDRAAWAREFPEVMPDVMPSTQAGAALPLVAGGRLIGAVGITFRSPRTFDAPDRTFLLTLAAQVAVAFERAALADVRGEIAETLQRSLLPRTLPRLDRLAVAARYLPGVRGTRAGGDWYDVLPRDDGRVALAVGDVVGEGAAAAAVMGQLRSALAGYLLEGHEPARALDLLDGFARSVEGAAVSTVTCLLLDPGTGVLLHASAGHPPPLVLDGAGARYLGGGEGPALALPVRSGHRQARTALAAGTTLLLYTDGLVERRGAVLDEGMERLAEVAAEARGAGIGGLVDTVLHGLVGDGSTDDVAVLAARLVPVPLDLDLVGDAGRLREVRAEVRRWSARAAVDEDTTDDLLLAVGEAAANAVEHAYGGVPGRLRVRASLADGERLEVAVADEGRWRPVPADPGFRGRGLTLVRELTTSVDLDRGPAGTVVRFTLELPSAGSPVAEPVDAASDGCPAEVTLSTQDRVRRVGLRGNLDLAGVAAVRRELLSAVAAPGSVVLDLRGLGSLSSSGLGLLLEAARARPDGTPADVLLPDGGPVRRLLDLTGLADALRG